MPRGASRSTPGGIRSRPFAGTLSIDGPFSASAELPVSGGTLAEVEGFPRIVEKTWAAHPDDDIRPLFSGSQADRKARQLVITHGPALMFTGGAMTPKTDAAA